MIDARLLKVRRFSRVEYFITFMLVAVLVAETLILTLIGHDVGALVWGVFVAAARAVAGGFVSCVKWTYTMVGPVVVPLLALTGVLVHALHGVYGIWRSGVRGIKAGQHIKKLKIVEGAAPGFGFLGTCISLMVTMRHMDPGLAQADMLNRLLENSSAAFGSTVYGMILAIAAFLAREMFQNCLPEK